MPPHNFQLEVLPFVGGSPHGQPALGDSTTKVGNCVAVMVAYSANIVQARRGGQQPGCFSKMLFECVLNLGDIMCINLDINLPYKCALFMLSFQYILPGDHRPRKMTSTLSGFKPRLSRPQSPLLNRPSSLHGFPADQHVAAATLNPPLALHPHQRSPPGPTVKSIYSTGRIHKDLHKAKSSLHVLSMLHDDNTCVLLCRSNSLKQLPDYRESRSLMASLII